MDDLPSSIVVDILSRLPDGSDLARCRLASKTLNSLSRHVSSLRLLCPNHRRAATPFKSVVASQIDLLHPRALRTLLVAVAPPEGEEEADYDEGDDRHLTDAGSAALWLRPISGALLSLTLHDFWPQSCWRPSMILALISSSCDRLVDLELRYAWLTVAGLQPLPSLKRLTLEFIRLDDEYLSRINDCFPSLEDLSLIGVGGLTEPKIHLLHLKTCHWKVSNVPSSLSITAPKLLDLKLRCVEPKYLVLRTPLVSSLALSIEKKVLDLDIETFSNLRFLKIQSSAMQRLVQVFVGSTTVKSLELEAPPTEDLCTTSPKLIGFKDLIRSFPNLGDLKLYLGAWNQLEMSLRHGGGSVVTKWDNLKKLAVQLVPMDHEDSISLVLDTCTGLREVVFLVPDHIPREIRSSFVSKFSRIHPGVTWKWVIETQ